MMFRSLGECKSQVEETGLVWRRAVSTRAGRNCILLSNGLLCVRVWGTRQMEFELFFFGTEYSSDRRRLLGVLLCVFSPLRN
jgi:hypothetical protein